jgi:tRNA(Ile)-lysidine synthase
MDLLDRVGKFILRHGLASPDTRLVAAVSGGSDSIALLHLLRQLHDSRTLTLVGVAHLNHCLRAAADGDQAFAARAAETLDLPIYAEAADVRARAARERRSLEDAAHHERYAFFERARHRFGADAVALGHTRDDQAETLLLRVLRGAGPHGWAGMYPRHGPVVRPLLDCRRAELRAFLDASAIPYVDDETNVDVSIVRNRVRSELLPLLESRFNPSVVDVLSDEAALARELWDWLSSQAEQTHDRVRRTLPPGHAGEALDAALLGREPPALARAVLWRALVGAGGGRHVTFGHVDAVLALLKGDADGSLDLPGQRVQRIGGRLVLTGRPPGTAGRWTPIAGTAFCYPLNVPGRVDVVEAHCVVSAELWPTEADAARTASGGANLGTGPSALVRGDLCRGPLAVRNRRAGDRFHPVGLKGRKKLQDLFVDRKIDRAERDRIPIVVDADDRIVWVARYGIDEAFRVTDPAQAVLLLNVKVVGGPA